MGVNDIKGADEILGLIDVIYKGPAHVVDLFDEIQVQVKGTSVIVNPFDPVIEALSIPHPGKDVHFVALSLEGGGQLGHMDPNTPDRDRIKGFPGQQGDPQNTPPPSFI
jgi:hypothetical protein